MKVESIFGLWVGVLVVAIGLSAASEARADANSFKQACLAAKGRVLTTAATFDQNGNVRADPIVLCINDGMRKISEFFVAASQNDHAYPNNEYAPNFSVNLKNAQGQLLLGTAGVIVATTQDCHHTYEHLTVIAIPANLNVAAVDNFDASMGGSKASLSCGQGQGFSISQSDIDKIVTVATYILSE